MILVIDGHDEDDDGGDGHDDNKIRNTCHHKFGNNFYKTTIIYHDF